MNDHYEGNSPERCPSIHPEHAAVRCMETAGHNVDANPHWYSEYPETPTSMSWDDDGHAW